MQQFEFYSPTKVLFGKGVEARVGAEVKAWGGSRVLVHFGGGSVKQSGLLDRTIDSLQAAGLSYVLLGGVVPNPRLSLVQEGIALCRREKVDFILAVGGGSAIDSAKAIAIGVPYAGEVWDFFEAKTTPTERLPHACILTLAATGSESSTSSVITREQDSLKRGFHHALFRPCFALLNPELLYTLPAYQTACGIVDIMMHTIERYFLPGGENEMTDRIAEALLKTVIQYGPICMREPEHYQARSEVMWAGSLSHNHLTGLGRVGSWSMHGIEHELSALYDVAHGAGLSAIWSAWAQEVSPENIMRFARFGANVWGISLNYENPLETALAGIDATTAFFASLEMPVTITALLGKTPPEGELMRMTDRLTADGTKVIKGAASLDRERILNIYRNAL